MLAAFTLNETGASPGAAAEISSGMGYHGERVKVKLFA